MDEKDQDLQPFMVPFGDREIMFNPPTEGQAAIIARAARRAARGGRAALDGVALILDVIDALAAEKEDRDFLEDGLVDGSITLNDFIAVLDGMNKKDGQPAKPVKAVSSVARSGRR